MHTKYAKKEEVKTQWLLLDVQNLPLGRLASKVAHYLSGKHKVEWAPHLNVGDFVILINANKFHLSGKKWSQKTYYSHSRYVGSLKEKQAYNMDPKNMIIKAVQGMLPKNKLRSQMLKKLKIYEGVDHPHQAQNPTPITI